jgi:hypothetical protein
MQFIYSLAALWFLAVSLPVCAVGDPPTAWAQPNSSDVKVILVQLTPSLDLNVDNCHNAKFDATRVELRLNLEDELLNVSSDAVFGDEEVLSDIGCFVPSTKLIYKDYTYVLSTYCNSAIKLKNSSPFVPSGQIIENDFVFTSSLMHYLEGLQQQHFRKDLLQKYDQIAQSYLDNLTVDENQFIDEFSEADLLGDIDSLILDDSAFMDDFWSFDNDDPFGNLFGDDDFWNFEF